MRLRDWKVDQRVDSKIKCCAPRFHSKLLRLRDTFLKSHTLKNDELFISLRINLEKIDKHKIYGYLTPELDWYKWKITWIMWLEFIVSIWVTLFCIEKCWIKILIKVCGFTVLFGCLGSQLERWRSFGVVHRLSSCSATCGIPTGSLTRDQTYILCIARWILNPWTIREVLLPIF